MSGPEADADLFEGHRRRLFGIAYGIVGQVMEAEDVVQDAWLRWAGVDRQRVENPAALLTTITTRLAIDRLRSARHRRESYVGPWLPEPIVPGADPGDIVADAERLSMAFLAALERLDPVQRAVLVLRDVFDVDYSEIATVVDRTVDNCRQIASRARARVGDADRARQTDPERERELLAAFVAAVAGGDLEALTAVMAADVTLWSDGGDRARAARHPILGRDRVCRFLLGIRSGVQPGDRMAFTTANGDRALYLQRAGRPFSLLTFQIDDGEVIGIRVVMNPDKLAHLGPVEAPIVIELR
ncbi:MAG: RNA polymerase sigma-70 factor [Acidimicrobiales bacterium]